MSKERELEKIKDLIFSHLRGIVDEKIRSNTKTDLNGKSILDFIQEEATKIDIQKIGYYQNKINHFSSAYKTQFVSEKNLKVFNLSSQNKEKLDYLIDLCFESINPVNPKNKKESELWTNNAGYIQHDPKKARKIFKYVQSEVGKIVTLSNEEKRKFKFSYMNLAKLIHKVEPHNEVYYSLLYIIATKINNINTKFAEGSSGIIVNGVCLNPEQIYINEANQIKQKLKNPNHSKIKTL